MSFASSIPANGRAPAYANYSVAANHPSNFGQVRVVSDPSFSNELQARAAGFVEGYLTAEAIFNHAYNMRWWLLQHTNDSFAVMRWLQQQQQWAQQQASDAASQGCGAGAGAAASGAAAAGARSGHSGAEPEAPSWSQRLMGWLAARRRGAATAPGTPGTGEGAPIEGSGSEGGPAGPPNRCHFWEAVRLALAQSKGMLEGYNARVEDEGTSLGLDYIYEGEWLALQSNGDLDVVLPLLFPKHPHHDPQLLDRLPPAELRSRLAERGRCSVLVKVTGDLSDLLLGHVTWFTYVSMTRLYKHYTLNFNGAQYKARTMSMSSYPGMVSSLDDWYILDSGLVVTETSNSVHDHSLFASVTPQSVLCWQRVLAANRLAASGADWARWFAIHNSGTYNNQWMVVDLKRFKPGQALRPGLLTVAEQLPGLLVVGDATDTLERGYWPSYNVPYFPQVYDRSGYPALSSRLSAAGAAYAGVAEGLSYQLAPRAKLARRDAGGVSNLDELKGFLRSKDSDWGSDPYANGSAWGAICARGDLDPKAPKASGCNDAKVTSYKLALQNAAEAVVGPTTGKGLQPFSWATPRWAHVVHRGMPTTFDFDFELQRP